MVRRATAEEERLAVCEGGVMRLGDVLLTENWWGTP